MQVFVYIYNLAKLIVFWGSSWKYSRYQIIAYLVVWVAWSWSFFFWGSGSSSIWKKVYLCDFLVIFYLSFCGVISILFNFIIYSSILILGEFSVSLSFNSFSNFWFISNKITMIVLFFLMTIRSVWSTANCRKSYWLLKLNCIFYCLLIYKVVCAHERDISSTFNTTFLIYLTLLVIFFNWFFISISCVS